MHCVRPCTQLVSRLEARFSEIPEKVEKLPLLSADDEKREVEKIKEGLNGKEKVASGAGPGTVSVTKYSTFWSERFQFVSAVKLGTSPSCINVLPFKDFEGLSKYVAVGDDKGKVYVFLRNGDVTVEFDALSELQFESSSITAMVSYLSVFFFFY
ncbi:putative membrane protein [Abeliophyllum distichum]|uniref:Membrane protein n=1 Tax=Abeliophyllum distichum TaxID=126358 RepID=A0ABD1QYW2_9LAMI